ncbi:MAG: hypothetical protein R3178_03705, partial [Rhodothermales bacterium]|nr:hypothetical protein [Rhodothermales bacterium]
MTIAFLESSRHAQLRFGQIRRHGRTEPPVIEHEVRFVEGLSFTAHDSDRMACTVAEGANIGGIRSAAMEAVDRVRIGTPLRRTADLTLAVPDISTVAETWPDVLPDALTRETARTLAEWCLGVEDITEVKVEVSQD